jgi:RNA polymerase sigma-70 factor, ECF subfamily
MARNTLQQSFSDAYEQFADAIFRHCLFRVRDRQVALDLMQETFMKVWRHLADRGVHIDNVRAFLYTVANNLIIDRSRKKKESSLEDLAVDGFDPGERDVALEKDPIAADRVRVVLGTINPKYREAVMLRYFDDLSPKEIAKILGISHNNASVRIHYGLAELRKKYPYEDIF